MDWCRIGREGRVEVPQRKLRAESLGLVSKVLAA